MERKWIIGIVVALAVMVSVLCWVVRPEHAYGTTVGKTTGGLTVIPPLLKGTLQPTSKKEVVRARRFELVDSNGGLHAVLTLSQYSTPELRMADRDGRVRATLRVRGDNVPVLAMADEAGQERALLFLHGNGSPELCLRDQKETPRIIAVVEPNGVARLLLTDADFTAKWQQTAP
jgi:hypothetical protein